MSHSIYRKFQLIPFGLIFVIFYSTANSSDDNLAFTESYFYDDLPVVLSASRLSQAQSDTPTAMTVIDRKMIQASAALNLPDLLRLVPGFTVGFFSGTSTTVSYHGHADEYARDMQVLIDGRSIYDPLFGGIPWTEIYLSLDEILRIEVIRGPNAAAYGSNSYAGVINIVTEHPADLPGTMLSVTTGYEKTRYVEAAYSDSVGKLDYRLSTSYKEGEGFDNRDDSSRAKWLKLDSDYNIDINNSIRTTVGAAYGNYDEGLPSLLQTERELDNQYNYQFIEWNRVLSEKSKVSLQFYHNYYSVDDLNHLPRLSDQINSLDDLQGFDESIRADLFAAALSGGVYDFDALLSALNLTDSPMLFSWIGLKSHRYDLEFEHTSEPIDNLRVAWGVGARHDRGESYFLLQEDEPISRDLYRLFLNAEFYASPSTVINAGGMLEKFEGKDNVFSPRLGVNYHLSPTSTFRISGSRAFRMPTIYEDNAHLSVYLGSQDDELNTWVINTEELDPQQIERVELGYFGNFTEYGVNFDLCLFHEKYSNIIDQYIHFDIADPDRGITDELALEVLDQLNRLYQRGAFTYTNFGEVEIKGIEFEIDFRPTNRDLIYMGLSYLDISGNELKRIKDGVPSFRENAAEKIPKRTFSLIASHSFDDGFSASSAYYFIDEMEWPGEGDAVPNFSRLDLKLNKHITIPRGNIDISLILQNLHNENFDFYHNDRIAAHNVWERRIYLQGKASF
ncbi:TonB-dependent receptor plug domain-containing protein [Candidatus Thiodiazotropha sp. CDECU1]|uniref:TonB-dependent receptor plug domain-containing protein n=1 Tax=Candidatus Thiodiazotropha sp. CDECU1 TaxID=3065865 RepID=UPI00292F2FD7|nr:TonB-dependent receptor [Candidatus Thiodiazotropha sp. CDECU1]